MDMADKYPVCLIGCMDRLWFHQIILIPQPFIPPPKNEWSKETNEDIIKTNETNDNETRARSNIIIATKTCSLSTSPSTPNRSKSPMKYSRSVTRLQKSMSCKSLVELEYEEVKGFMDLGFSFKKENMSPRMMSVVPGLQRIGEHRFNPENEENDFKDHEVFDEDDDMEETERGVMRPYLSEAWLIKRPDSPLLNFRIPRVSAAADMKKHLRFWARTVAFSIHRDS